MALLIAGLLLFIFLHLIPVWGQTFRNGAVAKIGLNPYKGIFALLSLGSFVLMVRGWKSAETIAVYDPPSWGMHVTPLLVLFGFILFIASNAPTNIRRMLRHPQLTGVMLWGIGHLFSNGDNRSLILFGGLTLYSLLAIIGSNQRDGEWVKRDKVPFVRDIVTVVIALALYAGFAYYHGWIIGVPAIPMS